LPIQYLEEVPSYIDL